MGCFLEFLYTNDYFPRKVPGQRTLEKDPSIPEVDMTGEQLLKHAKIYTLAEKFGVANLKNLASSKIHCVNSTAKGEIAYARYVYEFTRKDDTSIRAPVANFWATRSHTLRAEAEEEFRNLCLEFPEFGYDVLSMWSNLRDLLVLYVMLTLCPSQLACSTRSSSGSATRKCTRAPARRAARGRGPATAAPPLKSRNPKTGPIRTSTVPLKVPDRALRPPQRWIAMAVGVGASGSLRDGNQMYNMIPQTLFLVSLPNLRFP
jgi:hypothetical protein